MRWTTLLDAFPWIMGVISGGFVAWGGWLCLLHLAEDATQSEPRKTRARLQWLRRARLS
jgi:hypothetical protein